MKNLSRVGIELACSKGYYCDKQGGIYSHSGYKIKLFPDSRGYLGFGVRADSLLGRRKTINVRVHRFVAYKKYGECVFLKGVEVRHKNGTLNDNSYKNILIGTPSENQRDIPKIDRVKRAKHAASFIRRFTDTQETDIVDFYNSQTYPRYLKTMERFNVKRSTLWYILKKK